MIIFRTFLSNFSGQIKPAHLLFFLKLKSGIGFNPVRRQETNEAFRRSLPFRHSESIGIIVLASLSVLPGAAILPGITILSRIAALLRITALLGLLRVTVLTGVATLRDTRLFLLKTRVQWLLLLLVCTLAGR